jgi:hypothetical protein
MLLSSNILFKSIIIFYWLGKGFAAERAGLSAPRCAAISFLQSRFYVVFSAIFDTIFPQGANCARCLRVFCAAP